MAENEITVDVAVLKNDMANLKGELRHHYKDQESEIRKLHYEINKLEERITARIDRLHTSLEKRNGNGRNGKDIVRRPDTRYAAVGLGGGGGIFFLLEMLTRHVP